MKVVGDPVVEAAGWPAERRSVRRAGSSKPRRRWVKRRTEEDAEAEAEAAVEAVEDAAEGGEGPRRGEEEAMGRPALRPPRPREDRDKSPCVRAEDEPLETSRSEVRGRPLSSGGSFSIAWPKSGIGQPFSPATIAERGRRETSTEARIASSWWSGYFDC